MIYYVYFKLQIKIDFIFFFNEVPSIINFIYLLTSNKIIIYDRLFFSLVKLLEIIIYNLKYLHILNLPFSIKLK